MDDVAAALANARQALRRVTGRQRGLLRKAINELDTLMPPAVQVVAQTRRRVAGEKIDSATRVVSLHDPDARPIKKGRLGKPVEFGSKAPSPLATVSPAGQPRRARIGHA
jgi:IS5 family transposase